MKESGHQESLEFFRRARAKGLDGVRGGEKPKLNVPSGLGRTFGQVFANALLWGIVGLCASYVFYIYFPNVPDLYSSDKRLSAYYKASDIGQLVFSLRIFWPLVRFIFSLFNSKLSPWEEFQHNVSYFIVYSMLGAIPMASFLKSFKKQDFGFMASIAAWIVASIGLFFYDVPGRRIRGHKKRPA